MMWVQRTVDGNQKSGRNAPVEEKVVYLMVCRVFVYTSQVVQDFLHQQYEYPDVG